MVSTTTSKTNIATLLILSCIAVASAFNANLPPRHLLAFYRDHYYYQLEQQQHHSRFYRSASPLFLAGFGGGGGAASKKKKGGKNKNSSGSGGGASTAAAKLKPKAQWDRYYDLKKFTIVPVAVRVIKDGNEENGGDGEWLEVGRIKSENDEFTEIAVSRQKALIAEHSKRLYPLQVLPKDRVEWAYYKSNNNDDDDDDDGEWIPLDKNAGKDAPTGIDKKIGFEGKADPKTGFYCHYNAGRLVDREDEAMVKTKE